MNHTVLLDAGWQRQTTIGEPRLAEIADLYQAIGYEVKIVYDGVSVGCGECFKAPAGAETGHGVGTLYIRRQDGVVADDELF